MGPVTEWPALNSFFRNRGDGPQQTRETIKLVNSLGQGAPVLMVSHQVNVTALTGVFRPDEGDSGVAVVGEPGHSGEGGAGAMVV